MRPKRRDLRSAWTQCAHGSIARVTDRLPLESSLANPDCEPATLHAPGSHIGTSRQQIARMGPREELGLPWATGVKGWT